MLMFWEELNCYSAVIIIPWNSVLSVVIFVVNFSLCHLCTLWLKV